MITKFLVLQYSNIESYTIVDNMFYCIPQSFLLHVYLIYFCTLLIHCENSEVFIIT